MRPLTGTDILDFYNSRADLLILRTGTGEYDHIDTAEIDEGRPDSYNLVTLTDETDAQILLDRDTITDGEWFPDALDDHGNLNAEAADEMAAIITNDGVLKRCLKRASFASTAWSEAADKANEWAVRRASAVANVVDVVGGNQSEAARLLNLDQSTINRLVKKARAAAIAESLAMDPSAVTEQEDRALFDRAAYELSKSNVPDATKDALTGILANRDTSRQARVLLDAALASDLLDLTEEARVIVDAALRRARQMQ